MNGDREREYEAYAAIVGAFFAGLGVVLLLARRSPPASALDLAALSGASFKALRTLSRERVGSFVREPFVEGSAQMLAPRFGGAVTWTLAAGAANELEDARVE